MGSHTTCLCTPVRRRAEQSNTKSLHHAALKGVQCGPEQLRSMYLQCARAHLLASSTLVRNVARSGEHLYAAQLSFSDARCSMDRPPTWKVPTWKAVLREIPASVSNLDHPDQATRRLLLFGVNFASSPRLRQ